ncbi:MAG: hypothetical protein ACJATV_000846 [Granulosicoccus sp.]|jgi:hypothetical protein
MKRRQVITGLLAMGAGVLLPHAANRMFSAQQSFVDNDSLSSNTPIDLTDFEPPLFDPVSDHENRAVLINPSLVLTGQSPISPMSISDLVGEPKNSKLVDTLAHGSKIQSVSVPTQSPLTPTTSTVNKAIYFEQDYSDDLFVSAEDKPLLHSIHLRLKKLQSQIGYGHFNVLNFDDALVFAKRFQVVGGFTKAELDFIEKVFATKAADYGFYGEKVIASLTDKIKKQHTFKVPHTGHYLFKEQSFQYYKKLRDNVGEGIILTSGIRSNVKQLHLFLAKVMRVNGNLSRASRSLAPPGYSYHGIGDFDVGRKGWGGKNFTDAFSQTDEFKRMQDLGYITIRYDEGNNLGVRFEPWHIKVV